MGKLFALHRRAVALTVRAEWLPKLIARITLGVLFLGTGWGKVQHLDKVTAFFAELKIPAPQANAVVVSIVELVGGVMILFGVGTRYAAVPLASTMVVALVTAKRAEIHGFGDLFGTVEWTYLVMLGWLAFVGAGKVSGDEVIASRVAGTRDVRQ